MLIQKEKIESFRAFLKKKPENVFHQFFRYLISGGIASLVDLSILFVLYHFFGVYYLLSAGIAYSFGIMTNFTINVLFVFESKGRMKKEFLIFVFVGICGLLWTELILWTFSNKFHIPVMLAKIFAMVFVLFWNFFMRKKLVFKS